MGHILKCHDIIKIDFMRAEKCIVYDAQGCRYVDFESGIWCTVLGHNYLRITQAITKQLSQIMHLGTRYPNRIAEEAVMAVL
jgi:acetylornithine aminotransferase